MENIAWNICIACVKIEIDNFCLSGTNNIEEKTQAHAKDESGDFQSAGLNELHYCKKTEKLVLISSSDCLVFISLKLCGENIGCVFAYKTVLREKNYDLYSC